jgi:hypothetical protein
VSEIRFDILFDGTLRPDADPAQTRERLRSLFKLDDQGVARLFCGKPVLIKREADGATAARYKRLFEEAGALLEVRLARASEGPEPTGQTADHPARDGLPQGADQTDPAATLGLSLAPDGGFLEEPAEVKMREIDLSHLSLVPGPEWTLADCEPEPPFFELPDTSHLGLVAIDAAPDEQDKR